VDEHGNSRSRTPQRTSPDGRRDGCPAGSCFAARRSSCAGRRKNIARVKAFLEKSEGPREIVILGRRPFFNPFRHVLSRSRKSDRPHDVGPADIVFERINIYKTGAAPVRMVCGVARPVESVPGRYLTWFCCILDRAGGGSTVAVVESPLDNRVNPLLKISVPAFCPANPFFTPNVHGFVYTLESVDSCLLEVGSSPLSRMVHRSVNLHGSVRCEKVPHGRRTGAVEFRCCHHLV